MSIEVDSLTLTIKEMSHNWDNCELLFPRIPMIVVFILSTGISDNNSAVFPLLEIRIIVSPFFTNPISP